MVNKCKEVLARKKKKNEEDSETTNNSTHVSNSGNGPIDITQEMMPKEVGGNVKILVGIYEKIQTWTYPKPLVLLSQRLHYNGTPDFFQRLYYNEVGRICISFVISVERS
ncbi:hypothetical protein SUGI_0063690 [Cryptomeria japonica]|nr:hypothetical protein SUGI_0063690 [Cryptomeria japonica]